MDKTQKKCRRCNTTGIRKDQIYCSRECFGLDKRKEKIESICVACQKSFPILPWEKETKKTCSPECESVNRKKQNPKNAGANSHFWKGGIHKTNNAIRWSTESKNWAKNVKKRDDYECQICERRKELRANHIRKFADYPEMRFLLTNGITICKSCDIQLVMWHEEEWESYFQFSLMTRGII